MYTFAVLKNQIQSIVHVVLEPACFTECSVMPAFLCHVNVLLKHGWFGFFFNGCILFRYLNLLHSPSILLDFLQWMTILSIGLCR